MATLVLDADLEDELLEHRRLCGADRFDEVWDGVYVMSPLPNDEHQEFVMGIAFALHAIVGLAGLGSVRPGVNVSDRDDDWRQNYRCPDVAVYLRGTSAVNRGAYWLGGPDFAVEIASEGDRSREKLGFYAKVNTGELLLIDRAPWALELYRLGDGALTLAASSGPGAPGPIACASVPLSFRLLDGSPRPTLEIRRTDGEGSWRV